MQYTTPGGGEGVSTGNEALSTANTITDKPLSPEKDEGLEDDHEGMWPGISIGDADYSPGSLG